MIRTCLLLALLVPAPVFGAAKKPASTSMRFEVKTPKLTQELKVVRKNKKSVAFELNLSGSCQRTLTGAARLKGGDLEMDEDEKGISYPAEEFVYQTKTCAVYLRIKFKDATRATVIQAGECQSTCNPVEDLMFRTDGPVVDKTKPAK